MKFICHLVSYGDLVLSDELEGIQKEQQALLSLDIEIIKTVAAAQSDRFQG